MDFFMGLITGYFLNWFALSALVLLAVFFEAIDCPKTTVALTLLAGFVAYLFFGVPLTYVLYGLVGYAVIGVAWSLWRYRRYVRAFVAKYPNGDFSKLAPAREAGRIVQWMLAWPVSMVSSITGDIIVVAKSLVTGWLRGIYEGIWRDATQARNQ